MSQEIDQRVVEMRFDNAQFEKNSRDTMRTLDKLKEKLSFKGAAKGLEQVQAASENVDFSGMEKGLDTVQAKFSALDVIAFTALQRITDKVISTGEQMVKSLSVDQITSGWDKYNEKTSNVQTIMNATGKSIDQVNGYLNKLMWYSDETSYSFSEMTSALSQMTAAGGKIDKMIPMIMGIANATADAGKIGFAFQSTIRNLTQSYSAGHLQLQDWKSLNLMGTATKALKQELIDTAVELGVIKEGEVTIASFESSLQKKWANTKVMEKTFAKYASMMEAAYELTQKNPGMTSSEALEQLKGQYGELAERAALAAQQATSFGQAIDSTKDAVSSKWIYDNKSDVITPVGEKLTAEQWLDRYQWGRYTKMIVGGGIINGSVALVFDDEVERYRKAGCDFSACVTDEDYLAAIEAFEDNPPMADAGVSDQTRIADALEDMVALSLPDAE